MVYRELGKTGIRASEIGMGCEGFSEDVAITKKYFDEAEKAGVNYFDLFTPNPGIRKAVGESMKGRREKFVVQSHLCSYWRDGQYVRTRDLGETKSAFEDALKFLQTDYVDVGMIHYCDTVNDWDTIVSGGILDYAKQMKREGKIRHIGLSSHNPDAAMKAVLSGEIEVLMFSVNPVYDMQPPNEDVYQLFEKEKYVGITKMDKAHDDLYETCQRLGIGITVMKPFAGGDLLNAEKSPVGVALTDIQCISYCLSRPAIATVLPGVKSLEELAKIVRYETASDAEKDYAKALASFPNISWQGHCQYCTHCDPCPQRIDIASVHKFLNLARAQSEMPETVREHYKVMEHKASDCIKCGVCETRCPFGVKIRENMEKAVALFGE